jgi:glycosyltransferase involved in cell wall biosynthesis
MSTTLVSVVMPAYNAAPYLKEAIDSVLQQHYPYFELIIIDDASTDATASIVQQYTDHRILYLRNEANQGIVFSRNRGIAMAKGSFIAILDSDDIALPNRLEKQLAYMEADPGMGACGSFYTVIDTKGKKLTTVTLPVSARDIKTFLYFNVSFCHSTLMMRTEVARKYEYRVGFDIIEDYEIAYRISKDWTLGNLPFSTTLYRVHGHNISIDKKSRMLEVRRLMDSIVLRDLSISFTENELDLHSNFINMNTAFFRDNEKMEELEDWLLKFYDHLRRQIDINIAIVRRILAVRWFLVCYRSGHYRLMLRNRLFFNFKGAYMKYNLLYMKNMLTGHLEVV